MHKPISYIRLFAIIGCCFFFLATNARAEQVVVYSARIEQLIKPMFDAFTRDTGIQVKFTTDKEGALLARLKAEGRRTPADVLITVDAGNLWGTFALNNQTATYVVKLANEGLNAVRQDCTLQHGLNTYRGFVTHPAVAEAFGLTYTNPLQALQ